MSISKIGTGTPSFSKTRCNRGCQEATVGLFSAEDDDGTSYYFRGDVDDNYVNRLQTNKSPSFKCTNKSRDLYTVNNSTTGNKALSNPVGLITADEISMSGGVYGTSSNTKYYLYTGNRYWAMTPYNYSVYPNVFIAESTGSLSLSAVYQEIGVRPVINLRNDVIISGSGTIASPYIIS